MQGNDSIHNRPTPVLPAILSPRIEENVFSINLSAQMHATLFRVNHNNTYPNLVESFDVSKDQLKYTFTLKKIKFHNGVDLTSGHVKRSLESVIAVRSPGFARFNNVLGYEDFLKGGDGLKGITIVDDRVFSVQLLKPTPDLLVTLSDLRNVNLFDENKPSIGAGPFKLVQNSQSEILLENVSQASNQVKFLRYYQRDMPKAIADFNSEKADDLFLYPMGIDELKGIHAAHITTTNPPRTYVFVINSNFSKEERAWIYERLPSYKQLNKCYPDGLPAFSLAPKGRMGYLKSEEVGKSENKIKAPSGSLNVSISLGVGKEDCVKATIESSLAEVAQLSVSVNKGTRMVEKWAKNMYDIAFFYIEFDNIIDEYQFFTAESAYNFGVKKEDGFTQNVVSYYDEQDELKRNDLAKKLNQDILSYKTLKPVFYPKQHLVYSKKYDKVSFSERQDADMSVSSLKLKKG